jgi:hypothetical protein
MPASDLTGPASPTIAEMLAKLGTGTFGVPAVLGVMAAVSVLGLVVTLLFRDEDTE